MKLKTSPLFSLNQLSKIFLFICLGGLFPKAYSDETPPGIIESYEKILGIHKKQYDLSEKLARNNIEVLSTLTNIKDFQLENNFLLSVLQSSEEKYLNLAEKDECKLYSLLENQLLKTASGEINSITISFKDAAGKNQFASIPSVDFFTELYKKKCFNNKEFSILFENANFKKTIEGIKFTVPKNEKQCTQVHQEWITNPFTSYLCKIQKILSGEKSSRSDLYKQNIPPFQRTYLDNLCDNTGSATRFCQNYLKDDIWNKVLNGEAPTYKISYKCKNIFSDKESFGKPEQAACATKLFTAPKRCESEGNSGHSSIFPLQNCDTISQALVHSKLVTNYHDCPGRIDNEMLTNIHRIISHFDQKKYPSTTSSCAGEVNFSVAKLNLDANSSGAWPLKVCFINRVKNQEECTSYVPGIHPGEQLSEDLVIAKILYLNKGASKNTTCKIVDSKSYNPIFSEYKNGCFIIYDSESCKTLSCNKKVIWEDKTVEDIKFKGRPVFEYYSTNYLNERFSLTSQLTDIKGLQTRTIKNLTDLVFYLDKIPGSIIHGVGCAEDLLPQQFSRQSLNSCHPLPFIVDGHIERDNHPLLVFRSAIDDIHSPRLIMWQNVFDAVTAYQTLHPLNTWTLNGIKK